jgi:hypothetical protein
MTARHKFSSDEIRVLQSKVAKMIERGNEWLLPLFEMLENELASAQRQEALMARVRAAAVLQTEQQTEQQTA